jgi:hypothetical protein
VDLADVNIAVGFMPRGRQHLRHLLLSKIRLQKGSSCHVLVASFSKRNSSLDLTASLVIRARRTRPVGIKKPAGTSARSIINPSAVAHDVFIRESVSFLSFFSLSLSLECLGSLIGGRSKKAYSRTGTLRPLTSTFLPCNSTILKDVVPQLCPRKFSVVMHQVALFEDFCTPEISGKSMEAAVSFLYSLPCFGVDLNFWFFQRII